MADGRRDVYQLRHINFGGYFYLFILTDASFPPWGPSPRKHCDPCVSSWDKTSRGLKFTSQSPLSSLLPACPEEHHWEMSPACTCLLSTQGTDPKFCGISELWSVPVSSHVIQNVSRFVCCLQRKGWGYVGSFFSCVWKVSSPAWRNFIQKP